MQETGTSFSPIEWLSYLNSRSHMNMNYEAIFMPNSLVAKLAKEKIAPLVKKMDKEAKLDSSVIHALFTNGVSSFSIYSAYTISLAKILN